MKNLTQNSLVNMNLVMVIAVISVIIGSCSKDNTSLTAPANEVYIQSYAFSPATITVTVNTTIKWTNKDGTTHTVSSDASLFDSGAMNTGATFSQQFTAPGTYKYHCAYHSTMKGTIIVN